MSVAQLSAMPVHDAATAQTMFAYAQVLGVTHGVHFRSPPPEPTTCCGRGCQGCVWEGYVSAVEYWRNDLLAALSADTPDR